MTRKNYDSRRALSIGEHMATRDIIFGVGGVNKRAGSSNGLHYPGCNATDLDQEREAWSLVYRAG